MTKTLVPLLAILLLCACNTAAGAVQSDMTFTHQSDSPADWRRSETLYIGEDLDSLVIDATLQMDVGTVAIQIIDAQDRSLEWFSTHTSGGHFPIELLSMRAGGEYVLSIAGTDVQAVGLRLQSEVKLVPDPATPEREEPSKPERSAPAS